MDIKLLGLYLENFKGVRKFDLETDQGQSAVIRGKTALAKLHLDAFMWLLFNKDSQGKSDFAVKTLDEYNEEIHNLDHSVECRLELDGIQVDLRKVYYESYTKKRGSSKESFTGHKTDYFIDSVPIQKKAWDNQLADMINEDTFKLLTDPTYFNSLHWTKRRELLLEVCGDVADSDVIASDKDLESLADILNSRTLEDHRKVVKARKAKINDRLKEIPARIDELSRSIVDTSNYDVPEINATIVELDRKIQAAKDDTACSALRSKKINLLVDIKEAQAAKVQAGKADLRLLTTLKFRLMLPIGS